MPVALGPKPRAGSRLDPERTPAESELSWSPGGRATEVHGLSHQPRLSSGTLARFGLASVAALVVAVAVVVDWNALLASREPDAAPAKTAATPTTPNTYHSAVQRPILVKTVPVSPASDGRREQIRAESPERATPDPVESEQASRASQPAPQPEPQKVQVAAATPAASTASTQMTGSAPPPAPAEFGRIEQKEAAVSRAPDASEIQFLLQRSEEQLAIGNFNAARLLLERAALARDPRAALLLAGSYDPLTLEKLKVYALAPSAADVGKARAWYEKARAWGSPEAARRLELLATLAR